MPRGDSLRLPEGFVRNMENLPIKEYLILDEYHLFPELTEQGKAEAQNLMSVFESKLKDAAIEIIQGITTDFYCDILNEIESDHWTNYRTKIVNGLCDYSNQSKHGSYDFDRIRRAIYESNKEEIDKDLNQDLLLKIKELTKKLENSYKRI